MATKISALTAYTTPVAGDFIPIVDTTNATTKKLDVANSKAATLLTARTIGGNSFDGSANITVASATAGFTVSGGNLVTPANSTTVATILTHGSLLSSATADALENDAIAMYGTTNTTDGRGHIPIRQHFRLTSNGGAITTIANFFGTTSNISLVASAYYNIEIVMFFLKGNTSSTTVVTLTNSAAPTSQNIYWEQSPITGLVAPPGTATMLVGQAVNDATAAKAITTGSLTTAANHYIRIRLELKNGTGTSLKIQLTDNNGTGSTPLIGSYWTATRIPTTNTGAFAS